MAIQVHIWSDIVCPWCFVGKRRFERALQDFGEPVELTWHSFELDPHQTSLGAPSASAAERLAKKMGAPVERALALMDQMAETGRPEGIAFNLKDGKTRSSFDAHRLLHLAAEFEKQDAMKERLFRAHFEEALDVGDREVLRALGREVGLPPDAVDSVLDSDRFADEVRGDEASARELGISGVPFFVIGRYGISGAQKSELFADVLRRVRAETPPDDSSDDTPQEGDACDASGC